MPFIEKPLLNRQSFLLPARVPTSSQVAPNVDVAHAVHEQLINDIVARGARSVTAPASDLFVYSLVEATRFYQKHVEARWNARVPGMGQASLLIRGDAHLSLRDAMVALRDSVVVGSPPQFQPGTAFHFTPKVVSPYFVIEYDAQKKQLLSYGSSDQFGLLCVECKSLPDLLAKVDLQTGDQTQLIRWWKSRVLNTGRMLRKVIAIIHIQVE